MTALAACSADGASPAPGTVSQPKVEFSPTSLAVGGELRVVGRHFADGEVRIVLIPDAQMEDLVQVERERGLYVLSVVTTVDGKLEVTLPLPDKLVSENGASILTTAPGIYHVGVHDGRRLASSGELTVVEP